MIRAGGAWGADHADEVRARGYKAGGIRVKDSRGLGVEGVQQMCRLLGLMRWPTRCTGLGHLTQFLKCLRGPGEVMRALGTPGQMELKWPGWRQRKQALAARSWSQSSGVSLDRRGPGKRDGDWEQRDAGERPWVT